VRLSSEIFLNKYCFPVVSILQGCIVMMMMVVFWSQVQAIQNILYTSEDSQQQPPALSPIMEASEERPKQERHKRKSILDLDEFGMSSSSRQRLSDISDVQLCRSPLTSFS
jgi:hypothetical protein